MNNKNFNNRGLFSIILFFTFILVIVSALITHISHGTKISHIVLHIHAFSGIVFACAGVFHIIYNWKALKKYLMKK